MRIWRVVSHAPGRPDSPSLALHRRSPSNPPPQKPHEDEEHYENARPKNQLKASKQQHCDLCRDLSRASAQVTLHTILLGVGSFIYTPQTLEPLKELGLDIPEVTKLALKLHAHSVQ
eukprot:1153679-Pelagomonas_calceolata.AAC.2